MRGALLALLLAPAALGQVRVEPRLFVKDHHYFLSGGVTWLERGDYYNSPGAVFSGSYYLQENDALEIRTVLFASWLGSSAQQVVDGTGLVPDAHKPVSLLAAGWRHSITYGKVALSGSILHFDVQGGVDVGTLLTDRAFTPALVGFFGVVARLGDRVYGQLDLGLLGTIEQRSNTTATLGFLPVLTLGGWL
jgi:hypothetical protein